MGATFIRNAHNKVIQQHQDQDQVNRPKVVVIDKFSLCAFNYLAYNHEIRGL